MKRAGELGASGRTHRRFPIFSAGNGRDERKLGPWSRRVVFLQVCVYLCYSFATGAQEPSDFVGFWEGRMTGNGVNVAAYFDRWLDNGKLKGVMTVVPFFVEYEGITFNPDGTLSISTPSTLGVIESIVTVLLPTETDVEKTSRMSWTRAGGVQGGAGEFAWADPALTDAPSDSELTGRYQGILWPGVAENERIEASMEIQVEDNVVTGEIKLPAEQVSITKGYRFNNRIILEVRGNTMIGLWAGTATPEGIKFHWDMGVGYGQAEFQKTDGEPGEDGEP